MKWKLLKQTVKFQNKYMTVTEDEVVTDHGDKLTYGIVHKDPFAIIIPWKDGKTVLVGQYRYAVDFFSWEFPMGHGEPIHGSVENTARIELKEETGLTASDIKEIGTFYLGSGHHTQKGHIFVATNLTMGERELESSEKGMELKWVTIKEINEMISKGIIKDGPTITALKYFEQMLR